MTNTNQRNTAALLHLSVFTQYLFPFGNFIIPIVIWSSLRDKSVFVDANGRNVINFQLSLLVYTIALAMIAIPGVLYFIFHNAGWHATANGTFNLTMAEVTGSFWVTAIAAGIFAAMKLAEMFLVVFASVRAANGEIYHYPATIGFLKSSTIETEPSITIN